MDALQAIGLLARAQLEARRLGFRLTLRGVPDEVAELVDFCGLAQVLPLEAQRQPEQREERRRVEEERQL